MQRIAEFKGEDSTVWASIYLMNNEYLVVDNTNVEHKFADETSARKFCDQLVYPQGQ